MDADWSACEWYKQPRTKFFFSFYFVFTFAFFLWLSTRASGTHLSKCSKIIECQYEVVIYTSTRLFNQKSSICNFVLWLQLTKIPFHLILLLFVIQFQFSWPQANGMWREMKEIHFVFYKIKYHKIGMAMNWNGNKTKINKVLSFIGWKNVKRSTKPISFTTIFLLFIL